MNNIHIRIKTRIMAQSPGFCFCSFCLPENINYDCWQMIYSFVILDSWFTKRTANDFNMQISLTLTPTLLCKGFFMRGGRVLTSWTRYFWLERIDLKNTKWPNCYGSKVKWQLNKSWNKTNCFEFEPNSCIKKKTKPIDSCEKNSWQKLQKKYQNSHWIFSHMCFT